MNNHVVTSQMIADLPLVRQDTTLVPTFERLFPQGSKVTKELLEVWCKYGSLLCLSDLFTLRIRQEFETWMEIKQHDLCIAVGQEEIKYHTAVSNLASSFLDNSSPINTAEYVQKRGDLGKRLIAANKKSVLSHDRYLRNCFYDLWHKVEPCE